MEYTDRFHTPRFVVKGIDQRFPAPASPPPGCESILLYTRGDEVLVRENSPGSVSPFFHITPGQDLPLGHCSYLGILEGIPCFGVVVDERSHIPEGDGFMRIRDLALTYPGGEAGMAAFAAAMSRYDLTTRFCGRCGAETKPLETERGKTCPSCHLITYPRLSPAVIVLVTDPASDRILLARSDRFPEGMHSIIAGFVQPGETVEDAAYREVYEETSLFITNLRYAGSEPWPFPDSLMIGFTAEYAGGILTPDGTEVISAGWFSRDSLPVLPSSVSISRFLIDRWLHTVAPAPDK